MKSIGEEEVFSRAIRIVDLPESIPIVSDR